jgi:hypothetical protein
MHETLLSAFQSVEHSHGGEASGMHDPLSQIKGNAQHH